MVETTKKKVCDAADGEQPYALSSLRLPRTSSAASLQARAAIDGGHSTPDNTCLDITLRLESVMMNLQSIGSVGGALCLECDSLAGCL